MYQQNKVKKVSSDVKILFESYILLSCYFRLCNNCNFIITNRESSRENNKIANKW